MNYYIFTAIFALAASKTKVRLKDNQTRKEQKNYSGSKRSVARKDN